MAAVLECWLSGQAAGGAAADLLLGKANPSGKLAETIPLRLEDSSDHLNFPGDPGIVRHGEGILVGYRAYDKCHQEVSHPFGFGLSYTSLDISDVHVDVKGSVTGGDLVDEVSATVTNTGPVAGAEVVQVYVGDVEPTVSRPVRELNAFSKMALDPGENRRVSIRLGERALVHSSSQRSRWAVEGGDLAIAVGPSSEDLAATVTVGVDAPSLAAPLGPASTLQEWLADERGRALLLSLEPVPPILRDPELIRVIGSFPLNTLGAFAGMGLEHATQEKLLSDL